MLIEDEDSLKTWIMKEVASLTDAETDRLAMYIIALIKKPLSDDDLKELCLDKLDVFLQDHTKAFVDKLFTCLLDGAYLPEDVHHASAAVDLVLTDGSDQGEEEQEGDDDDFDQDEDEVDKQILEMNNAATGRDIKQKTPLSTAAAQLKSQVSRVSSSTSGSVKVRRRISPPDSDSSKGKEADRHFRGVRNPSPIRNRRTLPPGRLGGGRSERYHRRRSYSRSRSRTPRSRSRSPHREKKRDDHDGRRHRCRDFHEKGFCMRGDKCNYDHGPDPVVIENDALEKIVSRASSTAVVTAAPATSSGLYTNPPPPGVDRVFGSSASEGYNPEAPALTTSVASVSKIDFSVPPPPLPAHLAAAVAPPTMSSAYAPTAAASAVVIPPASGVSMLPPGAYNTTMIGQATPVAQPMLVPQDSMAAMSYSYGGAPSNAAFLPQTVAGGGPQLVYAAGGRGGRGGRGRYKPYGSGGLRVNPALCSLLVTKIPPEQNKIVMLDQHFGKFGQITNLHVQYDGRPDTALVTFKTRREALSAYKSTEPILNNRFIKVYWQTQAPTTETENGGDADNENGTALAGVPATTIPITGGVFSTEVQQSKEATNLNRTFSKTFTHSATTAQVDSGAEANADTSNIIKKEPSDAAAKEGSVSSEQPMTTPAIALATTVEQSAAPRKILHRHMNTGPRRAVYNPRAMAVKRRAEKENLLRLVELHRRKTELYTKQIEQQKLLLQRVKNSDDKALKKKFLELVKRSEESMKTAKTEIETLGAQIAEYQKQQAAAEAMLSPPQQPRSAVQGGSPSKLDGGVEVGGTGELSGVGAYDEKNEAFADDDSVSKHQGSSHGVVQEGATKSSTLTSTIPTGADKKKLFRVLYVNGCPSEHYEELIVHMEKFGDLFDFDITPRNSQMPCVFTYKSPSDAQIAVAEAAGSFTPAKIKVEWAPVSLGMSDDQAVVPDGERKPDERVTPAALLASLEYDEEDDEPEW